jgi:enamine deaminase RidA (YjgF/YER057c/UK114 family)
MEKQLISSGTIWENKYGYSRAVKAGNMIFVAGTTAVDENGNVNGINNAYEQAIFIFKKIEKALQQANAELKMLFASEHLLQTFLILKKWQKRREKCLQIFVRLLQ